MTATRTRASGSLRAAAVRRRLRELADPGIAAHSAKFFKTGPGEYGEGDRFFGIRVPHLRRLAREFRGMPLAEALKSLRSPFHEERLFALCVMVESYERGDEAAKREIFRAYLDHREYVNGWDLVDASAPRIVGAQLASRSRKRLYRLARSRRLWDRRIAMLATLRFIADDDFDDALALAERLLDDPHDLMHKAVGWMLREIGKRDAAVLRGFLDRHQTRMPRTMLRYAIERLPDGERKRRLAARAP